MEVKSDEDKEYDYIKYVTWLSQNEYKKEDGKSIKYTNTDPNLSYMNIKYTDVSYDDLQNLSLELNPAFNKVASVVVGQYQFLQDMKLKRISTNEPVYVVYRYNRIEKSFEEQSKDATYGAMTGVVGAIFAGAIIEGAITGGACAMTGVGVIISPLCAAGGFLKGIVSTTNKGLNSFAKVLRLEKISLKISKLITSSKVIDKTTDVSSVGFKTRKFFTFSKANDFSINKASMLDMAKDFEKLSDATSVSRAKNLRVLTEFMDEMNIDDIKDIDKVILSNEKNLNSLHKLVDNGIDNNMINEDILARFATKEGKLVNDIGDYKALRELLLEELKKSGPPSAETKAAIVDYIRVGAIVSVGATGGYIGTNINSKSDQYVDIMTKEQYFRLCGTERRVDERIKKFGGAGGTFGGGGASGTY